MFLIFLPAALLVWVRPAPLMPSVMLFLALFAKIVSQVTRTHRRILAMHHLLRLAVPLSFLLSPAPTFAQQNSQLIPESLTATIRGTENASLHAYFSSSEIGDVAVLSVFGEGNVCFVMFRIAYPDSSGKYVVTKEFGDCSDIPTIIFEEKQVTLKFPGYAPLSAQSEPNFRSPPPTTYVFSNGKLREIKTQNKRRR